MDIGDETKVKVKNVLRRVWIGEDEAIRIRDVFISQMESGLRSGLDGSSLQMENTYVTELINGTRSYSSYLVNANLYLVC